MENTEVQYEAYQVLEAVSTDNLKMIVEYHIKKGWKCQGGVFALVLENNERLYMQAVVK